jgi:hypothetical protein
MYKHNAVKYFIHVNYVMIKNTNIKKDVNSKEWNSQKYKKLNAYNAN